MGHYVDNELFVWMIGREGTGEGGHYLDPAYFLMS